MRRAKFAIALVALALVSAIGVADLASPRDVRFGFLYLVPIVVAGWWSGRAYALLIAAGAVAFLLTNDVVVRDEAAGLSRVWNEFTRGWTLFAAALLTAGLREGRDRLTRERERALALAVHDPLTGVYNRVFMREQLELLQAAADRHRRPYCVIAVDLDGLKELNDRDGHRAGDDALRAFADDLRASIRDEDVPVRTGGDEFIVLLADASIEQAAATADRIVRRVRAVGILRRRVRAASAGVASWQPGRGPDDVLAAADRLLYASKRAGGGRSTAEPPEFRRSVTAR